MTEPGVLDYQFGSPLFQKMGHRFVYNENFKRDLHLQPYTYNRVLGLILQSCFLNYRRKQHHFF
jgi:hypothetical protein